jgi:hypothetical protein
MMLRSASSNFLSNTFILGKTEQVLDQDLHSVRCFLHPLKIVLAGGSQVLIFFFKIREANVCILRSGSCKSWLDT